tara:strand:+ start:169 stop:408 length:240 start_codon:yes stop_codon:yes gene_type:complete
MSTLEALIEIARVNYKYMKDYLDKLYEVTQMFMQNLNDDHKISQFSIEIWNTLFEEEIEHDKMGNQQNQVNLIKNYDWT